MKKSPIEDVKYDSAIGKFQLWRHLYKKHEKYIYISQVNRTIFQNFSIGVFFEIFISVAYNFSCVSHVFNYGR